MSAHKPQHSLTGNGRGSVVKGKMAKKVGERRT